MRKLILIVLAFSVGCGGAYTGHVTIDPINVDIKADLTLSNFSAGFKIQCQRELGDGATQNDVNNCASLKLATLLTDVDTAIRAGSN